MTTEELKEKYCHCTAAEFIDIVKGAKAAGGRTVFQIAVSLGLIAEDEVEEIRKAMSVGLSAEFYDDSYVFLVDSSGDPLPWHGFRGNANPNSNAPYLECPLHTKEAWDAFQSTVDPLPPEETDPGIWGGDDQPGGDTQPEGGTQPGGGDSGLW